MGKYIRMIVMLLLLTIVMYGCSGYGEGKKNINIDNEELEIENLNIKTNKEMDKEDKEIDIAKEGEKDSPDLIGSKESVSDIEEVNKEEIICIDPGHQKKGNYNKEPIGPGAKKMKPKVSYGTQGIVTKTPEYEVNLSASNIFKKILEERGYKVLMTRTTHDVDISNKDRAEFANNNNANIFIRIHCDASADSSTYGTSILVPAEKCEYTTDIFSESQLLAKNIIDEYRKIDGLKVNGLIYRDDISGFNWSKVPTVLLELGFMTCPEEEQKLLDSNYLTELLNSVADGIDIFFEIEE